MVITPSTDVFNEMMNQLPKVYKYTRKSSYKEDPLTSGFGQQAATTAFFLSNETNARKRCVLPTEAAVLSSSLTGNKDPSFDYYSKYRPWIYQTVHFTTSKPWKPETHPKHTFLCSLLKEWKDSISGIEKTYHSPTNDFLKNCGKLWVFCGAKVGWVVDECNSNKTKIDTS